MAELPFLPLATDAWVSDTTHLSRVERGLYMDLLILMWRTPGCRVPNDLDWIARKLRCSADERETLQSIIREFCKSTGNWITQKRLSREHQRALDGVEKQRARAKARWNKEKDECHGNAGPAMPPTPTPTPTHIYSDTIVSGTADAAPDETEPVFDPAKAMFDAGVALLRSHGSSEREARSVIGKWRKEHGCEAVIAAIGTAKREGAIQPVSFITKALEARNGTGNRGQRRRDEERWPGGIRDPGLRYLGLNPAGVMAIDPD